MGVIPTTIGLDTSNGSVTGNMLALWAGLALFLVGAIALAVSREKYAVRIVTAEGEKDAVVSTKREYVAQIVNALNRAFTFGNARTYVR